MPVSTQPQVDVHESSLAGARAWFAHNGLSRPRSGRVLAGVCASVARRYDVNPLVARVIGIGVSLVLTPLIYVAAWLLMPVDADDASVAPGSAQRA
jgi:phage shock protein PspC (stress-responsive transcriptional regulator)